ncbi:hypothetical protein MMC25_005745 [Agyrium rufum]|nr:hypothetical protein [Agyrium rufum]
MAPTSETSSDSYSEIECMLPLNQTNEPIWSLSSLGDDLPCGENEQREKRSPDKMEQSIRNRLSHRFLLLPAVGLVCIFIVMLVFGLIILARRSSFANGLYSGDDGSESSLSFTQTSVSSHHPCAEDPQTAVALGCRFDPISASWLPPACYDATLSKRFMAMRKWTWWLEEEGLTEVPRYLAKLGQYKEIWVEREYVRSSCELLWVGVEKLLGDVVGDVGDTEAEGRERKKTGVNGVLLEEGVMRRCQDLLGGDESDGRGRNGTDGRDGRRLYVMKTRYPSCKLIERSTLSAGS